MAAVDDPIPLLTPYEMGNFNLSHRHIYSFIYFQMLAHLTISRSCFLIYICVISELFWHHSQDRDPTIMFLNPMRSCVTLRGLLTEVFSYLNPLVSLTPLKGIYG